MIVCSFPSDVGAGVLARPCLPEAGPPYDSHERDFREQRGHPAPAVSNGRRRKGGVPGKMSWTRRWQAARAQAQQPVCDRSGTGRLNLVRESGGKVTLALSGPPRAHLPAPLSGQLPHLRNSRSRFRRGGVPSAGLNIPPPDHISPTGPGLTTGSSEVLWTRECYFHTSVKPSYITYITTWFSLSETFTPTSVWFKQNRHGWWACRTR